MRLDEKDPAARPPAVTTAVVQHAATPIGQPVAAPAAEPEPEPASERRERQSPAPAAAASPPSAAVEDEARGSGVPADEPAPPSKQAAAPLLKRRQDPVEIEVVHEQSRAPRPEPLKRCYEIWTQNTVYAVDSRMKCVEVRTPATGEVKAEHPFLGARLVGGQLQQEDAIEMSYPLPRPGSFAVFESHKNNRRTFSRTSAVERVVLRMRIVTMIDAAQGPDWDSFG